MRRVFAGLAALLVLAVALQFFLAASGAFDSAPNEESFGPHRAMGYGILLYATLLTIIATVARMPGRLIGMSGLVAGLALLQGLIRQVARAFDDGGSSTAAGELVFGLHAINAVIILAVVVRLVRETWPVPGAARPVRQEP